MSQGERTVAIVGLGVMGGSIAKALRTCEPPPPVLGADATAATAHRALEAGAVNRIGPAAEIVEGAAAVVYATPMPATLALIREHASLWRADALVMDVVSLKAPVQAEVRAVGAEDRWVGAHPMAGSERSGFAASRGDLFRGARVWLTSASRDPKPPAGPRAERFWRSLGGDPRWIEADEHDAMMAVVSHLPQIAASALALTLDRLGSEPSAMGPGGRDMTRLAGSSPDMWIPLLEASAERLAPAAGRLIEALDGLRRALERRDRDELTRLIQRARAWSGEGP